MNLPRLLKQYLDGWVANLELGHFWAIYIGRLDQVVDDADWVSLKLTETELYRLNGEQLSAKPTLEIGWNPKYIDPLLPVETSTKLSTFVPFVVAHLVFYKPDLVRPTFNQAYRDMRAFQHL